MLLDESSKGLEPGGTFQGEAACPAGQAECYRQIMKDSLGA